MQDQYKPAHAAAEGVSELPFLPDLSEQQRLQLQWDTAAALGLSVAFRDPLADAGSGPEMMVIPAGGFEMGSPPGEFGHRPDEAPLHYRHLDRPFALSRCTITADEFEHYARDTGWRWRSDLIVARGDFPVMNIRTADAEDYCRWLSARTGHRYRLPTEAEWEYAARGGLEGLHYPNGDTLTPADGNYARSEKRGPIAVASYPPNGFGLHDVLGNVAEWVSDWYDPGACATGPVHNPQGPDAGKFKVIRGGGWHSGPSCSTVHFRNALPPGWLDFNVGFRCAKDVK